MNNNDIETDLSRIEQLAALREDENFRFRSYLKGKDSDQVDRIVHGLHREITEQIDCTLCGNCCSQLQANIDRKDIAVLAQIENMTPEMFESNFCEEDFDETLLNMMPCRYLEGTKCRIYENRPAQCRSFPNTDKKRFTSRLLGMLRYYEICPIVFNLMERLKDEMRFRRSVYVK
jgi:Fe-S-cluster containining protein